MNQAQRYNNPRWLAKPEESIWKDTEKRRWSKFYEESISPILKKLELLSDNNALSLAKNLWYSANADEQTIEVQLQKYKDYKVLQEDVQKFVVA